MHSRHLKFFAILRVMLATVLFSAAFHQTGVSQSGPDEPNDVFLPLVTKLYLPLPAILNGDFELGNNGDWTVASSNDYYLIQNDLLPFAPHSGAWLAWMGGLPDEVSSISQGVSLPADGPVHLSYFYRVGSEKLACNEDWMRLRVGAAVLASLGLCDPGSTMDWVLGTVDLSAYAGQTITIEFEVTTNSDNSPSSFFIDDVSLVRSP